MITRSIFALLLAPALAAPLSVGAQQPKNARIGYLSSQSAFGSQSFQDAFRHGLRVLGYEEGRNIVIEYRWADGNYERLPSLAKELVSLNLDVIVSTGGPPAARAAKAATTTTPIVFVSGNSVEAGIVSSLARPGGNLTGVEAFAEELDAKRLALLKETLPRAALVAVLWNSSTPEGKARRNRLETAAPAVGVKLRFVEARHPGELHTAFAAVARERADALLVVAEPMFTNEVERILGGAAGARLATIYSSRTFADRGGLMSYGADLAAIHRRVATYVDKILRGAKPGDLPIERPTTHELVINLKTAKALGLTVPQSVLLQADQVLE